MADQEAEQRLRDLQRAYVDFLDDSDDQGTYDRLVRDMVENKEQRLIVSINDLRRANPERASSLLQNSFEELFAFQKALKEFVATIDATYAKETEDFLIGVEGSFGRMHRTPRTLTTQFLGNLICLEGIVTKCSLVRPKVVRSVHYCPATGKTMERNYSDLTSLVAYPSTAAYPTADDDGNPLQTEFGLSKYKDHQTITIQEMPEKAPAGQLPRSVDVILDDDLVDQCKPGDRLQVVGAYRCLPGKKGGYTSGSFRTVLIANHVQLMSKEVVPDIIGDDVIKCKQFSKQKGDVFSILARSLAPSIHGHKEIKEALLCMLLGGVEKNLPNGTRLRGDINILLIGDPSVAKSQLLRYVLKTAPRAITTTGRGSSGVGLTAAVTTDQETNERRLEAGAMVLADRGVVCIDEFDKMSDIDRTAIHEVMEQGRVTIAKAGIHARLNARCSVLAAANPVDGRYNKYKSPMENIGLQDSLLSRFDVVFIMLDEANVDNDRKISDHVVRMHCYRLPNQQEGEVLGIDAEAEILSTMDVDGKKESGEQSTIYEKYDALLHGSSRKKTDKILTVNFMKKYIHIARCIKPVLTEAASRAIAEAYAELRETEVNLQAKARTTPVTARALETLIRLSTAHAKARLSKVIEEEDAEAAINMVHFAYYKEVPKKDKRRRRSKDAEASEEEADEEEPASKKRKKSSQKDSQDSQEEPLLSVPAAQPAPEVSEARQKRFMEVLFNCFQENYPAQHMELNRIKSFFKKDEKKNPFTDAEMDVCIEKMADENKVMRADEILYLI